MPNQKQQLEACGIGEIAFDVLSQDQEAFVMGATSRGIFIQSASRWLVFISLEPFQGPLTIMLEDPKLPMRRVVSQARVEIASGRISIPGISTTISVQGAEIWRPPSPASLPLSQSGCQERLSAFVREGTNLKAGVGLCPLLSGDAGLIPEDLNRLQTQLSHLQQQMALEDLPGITEALCGFLGWGKGLSPSGDDLVTGFLLCLNRWKETLWPGADLHNLNHQVVEIAYNQTTTLSANLIECATRGLGDERLIDAIDCILCGTPAVNQSAANLLGWGHSSGLDALVGIKAALSTTRTKLE